MKSHILDKLLSSPVIAATDSANWENAVNSQADILFHLGASILTVQRDIELAKSCCKTVFVHIDLAEGIGKDKQGIAWLKKIGVDGIISTRTQLIQAAHECDILAVQRFFILDSKGLHSVTEAIKRTKPDFIEIMPGVIPKALALFSAQFATPIIAGGLIEYKSEITAALSSGAVAVSTGKAELWTEIQHI